MSKLRPSRRTTLAALGAAASTPLLGCEPGEGQPGPGAVPPVDFEALRQRIDTVVVTMMENRSFDHLLGALSLIEGRDDVDGLVAGMANPHPDGFDVEVFPTEIGCLEDPPHSWNAGRTQHNEGANDGFVRAFHSGHPEVAEEAMGYFDRRALPVYYAFADHYTVCDRWHSSQLSSTWPNRFYSHAAHNGGERGNDFPSVPVRTIYTALMEAGVEWADYYANLPWLALMPDRAASEPQFMAQETDFFRDARNGRLPPVCLVDPVFGRSDDHPPNHPVAAQIHLATIYDALANSPQWDRTLWIISYDEHGGFFDHVAPPRADDERAADGFDQLGFRVPTMLVGPWVKPGHCSHVLRDHTSILKFIESMHGLEPLTLRDAWADDLLECFDAEAVASGSPRPPIELPVIEADEAELFAPECLYDPLFRDEHGITLQRELDDWADRELAGSPLDRRAQTHELFDGILQRALQRGLVRWR